MDHLTNATSLAATQERLHELVVPRNPKYFRVSNNLRCVPKPGGDGHVGFSRKFVEHGCYSIDIWDFDARGGEDRMRQQQNVGVGDILYMSESRKNNLVYRGIVKSKFKRSDPSNPSFFIRKDVFDLCKKGGSDGGENPHWQSKSPEVRKAWHEKRCEYICRVEWSEPVEINKAALNEGFIGKTIISRTQEQGSLLEREFSK